MPSKVAQALSLMKATGKAVKHTVTKRDSIVATTELVSERMSKCLQCPHITRNKHNSPRCTKCGCWLNVKTAVRTEECPIGEW